MANLGPKVSITIHGLEGLRIALNELPERMAANVLSGAVAKGARVSLKRAKELVPQDTGLLRRMLRATRGVRRGTEASAFVSIRRLSKKAISAFKQKTGKNAALNPLDPFYWSILEFGKSARTAHPFIRPAFEQTKVQAAQVIGEEIGAGIEKQVAKLRWPSGTK